MAGEFQIIHDYFRPLAKEFAGSLNLTDDAAVLSSLDRRDLVVTTDCLVEGTHFFANDPPETVGEKLLGVNLSDLAAMGANPFAYVMTVSLPSERPLDWLGGLVSGLKRMQEQHGVFLAGGDTVANSHGAVTLSLTAFGLVSPGGAIRRSGARVGDRIWVSGTLGDSAAGLRVLQEIGNSTADENQRFLVDRYRRPRPRTALGTALPGLVGAAIDVSDGLVQDLSHLCTASNVSAVISLPRIPLSEALRGAIADEDTRLRMALSGGDDYEILFCAAETQRERIAEISRKLDLPLTEIGHAVPPESQLVTLIDGQASPRTFANLSGFDHFSR